MKYVHSIVSILAFAASMPLATAVQAQTPQAPTYGPQPRQVAPPARHDVRAGGQQGRPAPARSPAIRPGQAVAERVAQVPKEFRLDAKQQQWVDQVLGYWEKRTSEIKTYQCDFKRWEYDPVFGPKEDPKTISYGEIRFAAPDKGMIEVTRIDEFDPKKKKEGVEPPFNQRKGEVGEHWVCDGESVFEFDHPRKLLIETKLPPEMHGKAISESPLPFLFGAKADTIKRKYWVRELPAAAGTKPKYYQLEVLPKSREDAGTFKTVQIFLDQKEFLPVGMQMVELNGQSRSSYQFYNRKENAVPNNLKNWWGQFVSPKLPRDWTKVTHDLGQPIQPIASQPAQSDQARQPSNVVAPKKR